MKKTSILALFVTLLSSGAYAENTPLPSNNPPTANTLPLSTAQKQGMQDLQLFKQWFGVDLKSWDEFVDFGQNRIAAYLKNLRTCTPGTYTYAVHLPMDASADQSTLAPEYGLETSTIKGLENGMCQVTSTYPDGSHTVEAQCSFSAKTLSLYSDDFAAPFFKHGNFGPFAYEANNDLYSQVQKECNTVTH